MNTIAIIQARMSSQRFPGKILAPFRGRPMTTHVIEAIGGIQGIELVVVATSTESSDDPLAAYLKTLGVPAFRGPLEDVFGRYRLCLEEFACDWFLRINADSPLLNPRVFERMLNHEARDRCDLLTTTFPRTFPVGQNGELVRTESFQSIDPTQLTAEEREHLTAYFYHRPDRFRIVNIESGNPSLAASSLAIDNIEDMHRLETLSDSELSDLVNGK